MTTPATATAPATAPDNGAVLKAIFRALGVLAPGAVAGNPANRDAETLATLAHFARTQPTSTSSAAGWRRDEAARVREPRRRTLTAV